MTNATIDDIRILKLAEMYERSYERFILEMGNHFIEDVAVLDKLRELTDPADDHAARIAAHLERLNAAVGPEARAEVQRAALLDVVEIERAAREFYLKHADRVHDPAIAALFRELARVEARHIRIAEDALAMVLRRPPTPDAGLAPPRRPTA